MDHAIDFVITWVDGNDPKWRAEKKKYEHSDNNLSEQCSSAQSASEQDDSDNRYRDWGLLKYWFRSVEKFAPWVNKIYFVTWGHVPEWLNTDHPKLVIVKHEEFIPKEYLPTFNSNVIYLNIHRIKGLSERFVIFDDDVFLTAPVRKKDFFEHGLPKECAIVDEITSTNADDIFPHTVLNLTAILNQHFSKHAVIKKNFWKYFNPCYGKDNFRTLLHIPYGNFSSFRDSHICASYLKSTYETVWEQEGERLAETSTHKFRTTADVPNWIMKWWQLCEGNFYPRSTGWGTYIDFSKPVDWKKIFQGTYKAVCVNDQLGQDEYEIYKEKVQSEFQSMLPERSAFERK